METLIRELLVKLGEDPGREGLRETPRRVTKSLGYLTKGYQEDADKILSGAMFESPGQDMILVRNIEFFSLCEHHLLPFFGRCHIGYIPDGKIVGLSKLARVVNAFARRLQVQERLTRQIADSIMENLNPIGVGVIISAKHLCMQMRGVEIQGSECTTSAMMGEFHDDIATRNEFLRLIDLEPISPK